MDGTIVRAACPNTLALLYVTRMTPPPGGVQNSSGHLVKSSRAGCQPGAAGAQEPGGFLLLQNPHFRHPWWSMYIEVHEDSDDSKETYMDVLMLRAQDAQEQRGGGTTPWTADDHMDLGGRAVSGTAAEVEPRREREPRATPGAVAGAAAEHRPIPHHGRAADFQRCPQKPIPMPIPIPIAGRVVS
jgi:hypothetical protein